MWKQVWCVLIPKNSKPTETYFAGMDIGSTMTKAVILDQEGQLKATFIGDTGAEHRRLANRVMEEALSQAGLTIEQIAYIVATGYGRINVPFADRQITEISCHARGVTFLIPTARTIIDIGGQDSKGIKVMGSKVVNFVMNDKCAAGTGRFLEVIAETLGVPLQDIGPLSLKAQDSVSISSVCTVFAEQEVVAHLSDGVPTEDILAGLHEAIANRVCGMVERLKIEREVVFTGGAAKNIGLKKALENKLGLPVLVPPEPLLTGAIGAAILGREIVAQALAKGEALERAERVLREATFFK